MKRLLSLLVTVPLAWSCAPAAHDEASYPATPDGAQQFVDAAEADLYDLSNKGSQAAWVQSTYITQDTQAIAAAASQKSLAAQSKYAREAVRFDDLEVPFDVSRRLQFLKLGGSMAAPADEAKTEELATIASDLEATYGKGEYCRDDGTCLDLIDMTAILAESRDADELLDVWTGWRTVSPPMRQPYQRFVELSNEGARELGFADTGAMWRSKYDMPADDFAAELDRLWDQVRPLYEALHCHVRARLQEEYGSDRVADGEPIPAHLLGNMWAQGWANVYELVAPPNADPGFDLTERLRANDLDALEMVRSGERFFSSLGFAELPETFWERSQFTKPQDRDVVCHASAWDVDNVDDLRIKMCIEINAEDFRTIHHELGHNYYQRAYNQLPFLYRNSANDGFHEAIGDTIALSVTPDYLQQIGLIDEVPDPSKDLGLLMRDALDKVAFLPFGLLVDQWRWKVFSGEIGPDDYNAGWWTLREKYQGVAAPVSRSEADFDAGAKYHIPANTPYTRYFLAHILQFQFHRSLCEIAGYDGPLNRCTIFGNEAAGQRLDQMLQMGASRPWPEALEVVTGSPEMDATAVIDYFAPLKTWLDEQNAGRQCGW
ncbi:MAG: M2 family metallopeptidase [Acidobacteriota bacterium]